MLFFHAVSHALHCVRYRSRDDVIEGCDGYHCGRVQPGPHPCRVIFDADCQKTPAQDSVERRKMTLARGELFDETNAIEAAPDVAPGTGRDQ